MTDRTHLEDRLRTALRDLGDDVATAPDAWQENQRRVAAARSSRRGWLLTAAAAAVVLLLVLGISLLGGRGADSGPPASGGTDDFWDPGNVLGPPVVAETLTVDGEEVPHEIVLSDTTGEGPSLCDRIEASGSASGSCTNREPGADDEGVAFDWLSGSEGDGDVRGVLAGVDDRVSYVDVWMSDGERLQAQLHPTGWEATQMFALTVPADGPRPQRVVASGGDRNVLQTVDLPSRFGDTWLPRTRSACAGTATASRPGTGEESVDGVRVDLGTSDALVTATDGDPACLEPLRGSALAAWTRIGDHLVVVTWPETKQVRVMAGQSPPARQEPVSVKGSALRVAVFTALGERILQRAEVVALDPLNEELDRAFVNQPKSP
jgi:hypothetical protein